MTQASATYFQKFMDVFATLDENLRILGGDYVLCPPSKNYNYECTPKNALTFLEMRVDGVHYAILKLDGMVRDDSPVVHVSPMDSDDVIIVAGSFLHYLADGCCVSLKKARALFDEETDKQQFLTFLSERFDPIKLLAESRTRSLNAKYGHLINY